MGKVAHPLYGQDMSAVHRMSTNYGPDRSDAPLMRVLETGLAHRAGSIAGVVGGRDEVGIFLCFALEGQEVIVATMAFAGERPAD